MLEKLKNIEELGLVDALKKIATEFGDRAAFSTSLSWEDQVITHHIFSNDLPIRVFTLDTGRLFPETYGVFNRTLDRYKKKIEVFSPKHEGVEKMVTEKGPLSFYVSLENRKECCFIRKVEPLNRALDNVDCWITGLRAEHSENRKDMSMAEIDVQRNILKVHPIFNWSLEQVKNEIKEFNIPYNSLHDKGFVSIGCQPCTRAVQEGEDFRAGRWWWENADKKECGLHS
jgi:phosphoadenosine phosphosulfate reductase